MYGIFTYIYHKKNQPFNVSKHPMGILLDPMGHVIISGFWALPARKSKKKRLEIHPDKCRNPRGKKQASHGSESLHLENFCKGKTHVFLQLHIKNRRTMKRLTSGSVKTSVTVGKMIREVKGPLLTFTIRILSDCCSVWPGPNVYIYICFIVYYIHKYLIYVYI